jgi:hypothetical protein
LSFHSFDAVLSFLSFFFIFRIKAFIHSQGTPEPEAKDLQKQINEASASKFGVRVEDL